MNNRRSFFKSLIGLIIAPIVAPKVAEALPIEVPISSIPVYAPMRRLRANWSIEVEQDLMRMHGIDLDAVLLTNMSKAIQDEIDNDMVKNLVSK